MSLAPPPPIDFAKPSFRLSVLTSNYVQRLPPGPSSNHCYCVRSSLPFLYIYIYILGLWDWRRPTKSRGNNYNMGGSPYVCHFFAKARPSTGRHSFYICQGILYGWRPTAVRFSLFLSLSFDGFSECRAGEHSCKGRMHERKNAVQWMRLRKQTVSCLKSHCSPAERQACFALSLIFLRMLRVST